MVKKSDACVKSDVRAVFFMCTTGRNVTEGHGSLGCDIFFCFSCIVVRALQSRIYLGCGTVVTASLDICSVADTFTSRLLGA